MITQSLFLILNHPFVDHPQPTKCTSTAVCLIIAIQMCAYRTISKLFTLLERLNVKNTLQALNSFERELLSLKNGRDIFLLTLEHVYRLLRSCHQAIYLILFFIISYYIAS